MIFGTGIWFEFRANGNWKQIAVEMLFVETGIEIKYMVTCLILTTAILRYAFSQLCEKCFISQTNN